jgi:hypothetical protein
MAASTLAVVVGSQTINSSAWSIVLFVGYRFGRIKFRPGEQFAQNVIGRAAVRGEFAVAFDHSKDRIRLGGEPRRDFQR